MRRLLGSPNTLQLRKAASLPSWRTDFHLSRSSTPGVSSHVTAFPVLRIGDETLLSASDHTVAPAIGNTSMEPSADDFLARERAVLGDDANLFATAQDATAYNVDVLGGEDETSKFKSQFPEVIPQVGQHLAARSIGRTLPDGS